MAATVSGLTFSGVDHPNTFFDLQTQYLWNQRSEKKSLNRQLQKQYQYAQLYALNSPSWSVQGLRKANLNPILAATDGAFSSPTVPNASSSSPGLSSNTHSSAGDIIGLINGIKQGKLIDASVETEASKKAKLDADTEKVLVDTENARKNQGLSGQYGAISNIIKTLQDEGYLSKHTPSDSSFKTSSEVKTKHVPLPSEKILGNDELERTSDAAFGTFSLWRDLRREEREGRARRDKDFELRHGHKFRKNSDYDFKSRFNRPLIHYR